VKRTERVSVPVVVLDSAEKRQREGREKEERKKRKRREGQSHNDKGQRRGKKMGQMVKRKGRKRSRELTMEDSRIDFKTFFQVTFFQFDMNKAFCVNKVNVMKKEGDGVLLTQSSENKIAMLEQISRSLAQRRQRINKHGSERSAFVDREVDLDGRLAHSC
jgi:hypothetical protein